MILKIRNLVNFALRYCKDVYWIFFCSCCLILLLNILLSSGVFLVTTDCDITPKSKVSFAGLLLSSQVAKLATVLFNESNQKKKKNNEHLLRMGVRMSRRSKKKTDAGARPKKVVNIKQLLCNYFVGCWYVVG